MNGRQWRSRAAEMGTKLPSKIEYTREKRCRRTSPTHASVEMNKYLLSATL